MCKRLLLLVLGVIILTESASAQNPCAKPVVGNCIRPDTCCILPNDQCPFVPGDINASNSFNSLDITLFLSWMKGRASAVVPYSQMDYNGSCSINGMDIQFVLRGGIPRCSLFICHQENK
jgi:hypothetical protein